MDHVELILKLKDLLRDTCGKQAIAHLIHLPLIVDYLNDPENFLKVVDKLGSDCQSWNPINICSAASGFELQSPITISSQIQSEVETFKKSVNLQSIDNINSIVEIYPLADRFNAFSKSLEWSQILEQTGLGGYSFSDPKKKLETIFGILFEISDDKKKFIDGLIEYQVGHAGTKLLSRLILNNKPVNDYVINALETKSIKPSPDEFVSLMKEMRFLGDQEIHRKLAGVYLEGFPYDEKVYNSNEQQEIEKDLLKLRYLKNYSELLQLTGSNNELEKLTRHLKDVLSTLGQELGFITNFESSENKNGSNKSEMEMSGEISRIKGIAQTDLGSANALALEFSEKILGDPDFANSIYDKDFGFLIEPEKLAQFLINFGLFSQAQDILNNLLAQWPQNSHLLRIAANLAHDKGDHRNAAGKFALLDLYDDLTREEKIKFATSLEYLDSWENAYGIRKTINISIDEDFRNTLLCVFYGGKINEMSSLISENEKFIRSSKIASVLKNIAEEDKEQVISMVEKLEASDYSNEKDLYYFLLISDYLRNSGNIGVATSILENIKQYSKFSFSIVNRLHSIYQEKSEREKSRSILSSIKKNSFESQKELETFIDFLIQTGEIDRANQFLISTENSWELSPRKINLIAKLLIEKGKYSEAEKILLPLVRNINNDNDENLNYCLAVLKCKFENFPFGIEIENLDKFEEIRKIIKSVEEEKGLLPELLNAELSIGNRFEKYQQILNKYSSSSDPDVWRIYAGLGRIYFDLNQFDSAIINLKRGCQIQPNNQVIFWLLIQSYANLRLWNEIEILLDQAMASDSKSILRNFKEFGFLKENSEWPRFLENQIQKKPDEIVYKVFLAQYFAAAGKNIEAVEIIKGFYENLQVESDLYLLCIQILIDAHEIQLAERLIEIFLVNKKSPDQSDYLACMFLFEQLGRSEKALTMMNHIDNLDFALLSLKSKLLRDLGKTEQSEKVINDIIGKDHQVTNIQDDLKVRIPDFFKQIQENPSQIYLMAASFAINNNDTEKAISILERGLKKNPDDQKIKINLLDLLNLTGKTEKIEGLLQILNGSASETHSYSLLCLLGEIALSRGEEVTSARYLSEALKLAPEDPRIKALQARIVVLNGNAQEAKLILDEIVQNMDKSTSKNERFTSENYGVDSKLWLAEASIELKHNKTTLEICQQEIMRVGYQRPLIHLFLSALSREVENRFVIRELKANDNFTLELEEWLKIFSEILENHATAHSNGDFQDELIIKCQLFLKNDPKVIAAGEKLIPNPDNIDSLIYSLFKSKGLEAAEIAFNSLNTFESNEFFLAVLEKDLSPEKSLGHLQKAIGANALGAIHNALLANIEKNLGNFSDAYSAISLALEQSPNEYEWEIMAGDLCKLKGDLHASISHYQNAQTLNIAQSIDKNIDDLYLSLGTIDAIPILEKQLLKTPNIDQTIQLGKIYLKAGNYRKAVKVFESATKEYPQNADPYYWLSELSLNLDNPGKALDNIEQAIAKDGLNNQFICKKAEIINKINGFSQAINFIDDELSNRENKNIKLLKYKVRLISEHDGEKEALKMLNLNPNLEENPELMLEKALLELRLGKTGESELIAEKLLENIEVKADALSLLGAISKTKGEFDRAIDFFIKSIESDPFSIEKFVQLAEIYHDKKEFKSAVKTLEDGMRSNPGSFDLLYRSGLYFYQQGGYNEAGKCIREAIKIKPDHREAKELLGLLESVIAVKNHSFVDQIAE